MTEQKRRCLGNINLQLEDGLWHRYSKDEIDSVIEMSNALYRICPAPDEEFNIKRCPMNCPFRPRIDIYVCATVRVATFGNT